MRKNTKFRNRAKNERTFFFWFMAVGGDLSFAKYDGQEDQEQPPVIRKSSFSERGSEIKRLHNYQFRSRHEVTLDNYPDLQNLTFEPIAS